MKMYIPFTWKNALATKFSPDRIKAHGVKFRKRKLMGFIDKKCEDTVQEIRSWLEANEIKNYKLFGVFDVKDSTYYSGLVIEFNADDDLMLFKLRF